MRVKWIEQKPDAVRVVRFLSVRKLKHRERAMVATLLGAEASRSTNCDTREPSNTGYRERNGDRSDSASAPQGKSEETSLLRKELDELNNWGRLGFQLYLGWFTLQSTANGLAIGWLLTRSGPLPWFSSLISLVFFLWNLMGILSTVLTYKELVATDLRIKRVLEAMAKVDEFSQHGLPTPRSPMPRKAISTTFGFCVCALFIPMLFWIVMLLMNR